jgi:hypothetical protein
MVAKNTGLFRGCAAYRPSMETEVLAAAAEAVRRSGANAVEQFSDFAEIFAALGDDEASELWARLAAVAAALLTEQELSHHPRRRPRAQAVKTPAVAAPQKARLNLRPTLA